MTQNEIIPTIDDGWRGSRLFSLFPHACDWELCHHEWSLSQRNIREGCDQVGRARDDCWHNPKGDTDASTHAHVSRCLSGGLAALLAM